ncbi:MAG TPA: FxLYD domain-containing protein [Terriglobia bacterium]|jgi:hypothetical protein
MKIFHQGGATVKRVFSSSGIALLFALAWLVSAADGWSQRQSMELLETKISATQTTIDIVGQVKNIATRPVEGVTVHCDFQDASGKSIRVEQGRLDTDPLAPSKISQFKISTPYNAAIKRYNVTFSQVFGGPLLTKDSRKP